MYLATTSRTMATQITKLGVLADPYLQASQAQALEAAVDELGVDIATVIVTDATDGNRDPDSEAKAVNGGVSLSAVRVFVSVLRREGAWAFAYVEKKLAEQLGSDAAATSRIHVDDVPCFADSEIQYVSPIEDGPWSELPSQTVAELRERCDVVVRYGFGLIRGEILTATEYGVLSFHPADIRQYRGLGAPQAWLDGRDRIGLTLQRLNENVDGGEIVAYKEIDVSDCATLWEVFDSVRSLQADVLIEGLQALQDPSVELTVPESLGPYYSPKSLRKPSVAGRTILKNTAGRLQRLIGKH